MPSVTIHNLPSRPAGSGLRLEEQQQQQESDQTQQDTATAELDARIASLQEQISSLTSRREYITSTILSSPTFQSAIKSYQQQGHTTSSHLLKPLTVQLEKHTKHVESNLHRLVFSVTSFPYTDPSPNLSEEERKLLGVRIDVSRRDGGYEVPFYILLKRVKVDGEVWLSVHRHTIPAFIPVRELERVYLPVPTSKQTREEEEEDEISMLKAKNLPKQDLHTFVAKIRNALVSWHLRVDAVKSLQKQLASSSTSTTKPSGLKSITATSLEHSSLRLEFHDGRVGRVKVGETGQIERVIVISADGGREKEVECAVMRGADKDEGIRIDRILSQLEGL